MYKDPDPHQNDKQDPDPHQINPEVILLLIQQQTNHVVEKLWIAVPTKQTKTNIPYKE
jgi:hypothetical protein